MCSRTSQATIARSFRRASAGEAPAQFRVLGRHADRAGVQMADAHHDAAHGHQRPRGKAEFLAPSIAAMTTSRPVLSCPSVSSRTWLRRLLSTSV